MTYNEKTRLAGRGRVIAQNNRNATKHSMLAHHYCYCRAGATCIFCLAWDRLICHLEARRLAWRAI